MKPTTKSIKIFKKGGGFTEEYKQYMEDMNKRFNEKWDNFGFHVFTFPDDLDKIKPENDINCG